MKFNDEKKQAIKLYLLEKIDKKTPSVSATVADTFNVNPSTIHSYINELLGDNIIQKVKRGEYELVKNVYTYSLSRKNGDLDSDTYALSKYITQHICDFDWNVQGIWDYSFSEMMNNVMDHSGSETAEVVVEQDYLNTCIWIFDKGVGIFNKLKDFFKFESIDDAIRELFKGKLTTDSKNHSGEGIFFTSRLMDNFFIVSSGRIFAINKYDDSRILDVASENLDGTGVMMELSNFSKKTAKDIFNEFENEDGGFDKTKIPMKNIFDAPPISRSQAKRISNHLEKFHEVIIDFDGISWMGQAFAHELFVVFANNHPEIIITPIQMGEDVAKMYFHVMNSKP